jgi:peptidoglycan-associated lipoprotein
MAQFQVARGLWGTVAAAALVTAAGAGGAACASKGTPVTPEAVARDARATSSFPTAKSAASPRGDGAPAAGRESEGSALGSTRPIYFELESSLLSFEARSELERLAEAMRVRPHATLTIYGHCDERGADEYNLALGEHRAQAAREYLRRLGIDESRVRIVSYGEEKPAAAGHDEASWAQNRRDEFELVLPSSAGKI